LQKLTRLDRIPRQRVDKFAERRAQLAEAALKTLSELGYARTSLREMRRIPSSRTGFCIIIFATRSISSFAACANTRRDA
jgi:hypothetical protein